MRIKLDTPEEIAKWREERKRFAVDAVFLSSLQLII